jgi:prevent-host-death family protein
MQQFNVAEAKARFSQLIRKALAGEDVVIAKDNKPLVKLVPLKRAARRRQPGSARGRVWTTPPTSTVRSTAPATKA